MSDPNTITVTSTSLVLDTVTVTPIGPLSMTVGDIQVFTATARDQYNNPISGVTITWADGGHITVSPASGTTDSSGQTSTTVTADTSGTTAINTISGTVISNTVYITIAEEPVPTTVTISPLGSLSMYVGNTQIMTATLTDQYGDPMSGVSIFFGSGLGAISVDPNWTITDVNGQSTTTVTALSLGDSYVRAAYCPPGGGTCLPQSSTVYITIAEEPVLTSVTLSPAAPSTAPLSMTVGNTQPFTATARDQHNNPLSNQTITWNVGGSGITVNPTSGITGANGQTATTATAISATVLTNVQALTATVNSDATYITVTVLCVPNWQCRQPLDGYEHDVNNCGEADRLNAACNPPCIPNWQCEQPLNGYEADGCGNRRLNAACNPCVPNWQCEQPLNGYEADGCGNRRLNAACNPPTCTSISISADKTSANVGDTIILTATTQPGTELFTVEFRDQDNNLIESRSCTAICSSIWDTTGFAAGVYIITGRVGDQCISGPITVTLAGPIQAGFEPSGMIIIAGLAIGAIIQLVKPKTVLAYPEKEYPT